MAVSLKKIKLKSVLESNTRWPLLIGGAAASDFAGPVMPATISPRDLNTGNWVGELGDLGAGMDRLVMIIDGMDKLTPRAQEKFIRLIKDRRGGMHKLPDNVQIVIPVKNVNSISDQIKRLALIYNV